MNYLTLCQEYVSELGIAGGTGPSAVDNQVGEFKNVCRWIRDSALYIDNLWRDWKYLWRSYDVVASTSTIPMPSLPNNPVVRDWNRASAYLNYGTTGAQRMMFRPWKDWIHQYAGGISPGQPSEFTERPDRQLLLNRSPSAPLNFHAEYWKRPTILTANSSTPDLPEEWHRFIIVRAAVYYGNREAAAEIISGMEAEYADTLEKLQSAELESFRPDFMAGQDIDLAIEPAYRGDSRFMT